MSGTKKTAQDKHATAMVIVGVLGTAGVVWYLVAFAMGNLLLGVPGIALLLLSMAVLIVYPRIRSSRGSNVFLHAESRVLEARRRFDQLGAEAPMVKTSLVAAESIVAQIREKGTAGKELVDELVALTDSVHSELDDHEPEGADPHARQ